MSADARYLDTGHIIYSVGTTLFAVPVDVQTLRVLGAPVMVVDGEQVAFAGEVDHSAA